MRSAVSALAWEFWGVHRRGWLLMLATIVICGVLFRAMAGPVQQSDGLQFFCHLPMVFSLILAATFCNITDRERKDGVAGFPRHLFVLPIETRLLVTILMACAVLSVVGLYVAWAVLVIRPLGIDMWVRWPATLLAVSVVFYQAIVWSLCGYRLTRVVALTSMATLMVLVGCLLTLAEKAQTVAQIEFWTTTSLLALTAIAYSGTVLAVGSQRRGGGQGSAWVRSMMQSIADAIPRRRWELESSPKALLWMEWRRSGAVLPLAVFMGTLIVLGPGMAISGHDHDPTFRAAVWLALMPMLLAFPIGMAIGKPDFWSSQLALSAFASTRPVTNSQMVAAKMKSAALSTLTAWSVLLAVAPVWIYFSCDTVYLNNLWHVSGVLYGPVMRWAVAILLLLAALVLTWSLMVGSIWLGCSGRAGFFYSLVSFSMAAFLALLITCLWWVDNRSDSERSGLIVNVLGWIPWLLAVAFTIKTWFACWSTWQALQSKLISERTAIVYLCCWLVATAGLVLLASLLSPRINWLRYTFILAALLIVPAGRVAAAPLTVAWNRHG